MSGDVSPYLGLITSEHAPRPNFMASVAASVQPFADAIATLQAMPAAFDVDEAVGAQLDITAQWVGATRALTTEIEVYFSLDTAGLGFDQGTWYSVGDPTTGSIALDDDGLRVLIKAKIAANQWDGTIPGAYAVWAALFPVPQYGPNLIIQDHQDMTMTFTAVMDNPTATTLALLNAGYLTLKPSGVAVTVATKASDPALSDGNGNVFATEGGQTILI